jgi:hypothetical protein
MEHGMTETVKPFKVVNTRIEDDGELGVTYQVQKIIVLGRSKVEIKRLEGYMSVPVGQDADVFLFSELSKAGWF